MPNSTPRTLSRTAPPNIIQGGMGIGVSSWQLARRVAQRGEIGVVSGTGIDAVVVRELQEGDPHDRRRVLSDYPDTEIADDLVDRFYQPEGRAPGEAYDLLTMHGFDPSVRSQRILAAATFTEVRLAKEGHDGLVGLNLLAKLKRYTLPCIYGALLAGVDIVSIGAGIPMEEARQIPKLAAGEPAELSLDVDTSQAPDSDASFSYRFDPADVIGDPPALAEPLFLPIVSSDVLARILDTKLPDDHVDGWVVETPVAGGHNAPPRNKNYAEDHTPLYDERDEADLEAIRALDKPFYLAGGYGSPRGLRFARSVGAAGIQVGSLFSLADESGYPEDTTRRLIRRLHSGDIAVSTDGRVSSTGFPFKVLTAEDTLADDEVYEERGRVCDLGYLREPYLDGRGRLMGRCPAEPVKTYESRGGDPDEAEGRACLCNALLANIGHAQRRKDGPEPPLFTGGDALEDLPLGSEEDPQYDADDVIDYLYGAYRSESGTEAENCPRPAPAD
jgi:NAD(P)H-dependent flavin oxidoreductase YrpB (nitropropane dioxygenase family)